ncbi:hypothetical protein HALDL1_13565 [Halobacterium sp. DL1]|jgi:hypothetical protein|nr:hypothetical protein HALDL1_13565 [Halobacterium sp. DL1]
MFEDDGSEKTNPIEDPIDIETDPFQDPIDEVDLDIGDFGIPVAEEGSIEKVEDVNEDSVLCDCGPQYKHTETVLKERGASLGALGGNYAGETTVIICTDCGTRYYEDESYQNDSSGLNSLM